MPKFEFIGVRENESGQWNLYRDENGQVHQVPATLANNRVREEAFARHDADNRAQEANNAARAQAREASGSHAARGYSGPISELYPLSPDADRALAQSRQYNQDIDQRELNRRNIQELDRYKAQVMTANLGGQAPAQHAQPIEQLQPAHVQQYGGYGGQFIESARHKTGMDNPEAMRALLDRGKRAFPQAKQPDATAQRKRVLDDLLARYGKVK